MLEQVVREMAAKVGKRLRRGNLAASTVKLKLRWPNFTTLTRQITLPTYTDLDEEISSAALHLLHKVRPSEQAVRLIGVGVSGLGKPIRQISLWNAAGDEKSRAFHRVFDALQDKYGEKIIKKGI